MTRWGMLKNKPEIERLTPPPIPEAPSKQGCATSFLTQKGGEMNKVCGQVQPEVQPDLKNESKEQYVQPDEEKESGGES